MPMSSPQMTRMFGLPLGIRSSDHGVAHYANESYRGSGSADASHAPEADVCGGRVHGLTLPRCGSVAMAITGGAQMGPALGHPTRDRLAWSSRLVAAIRAGHARVARCAACMCCLAR